MKDQAPVPATLLHPKRLMSLDVFRGATIAMMMLVNNPGDWGAVYAPLRHAEWNGWTLTDCVFPFFLWIVGLALPIATAHRLEQGQSRRQLLLHAVRRAAILFGLGLFLNSFNYLLDGSLWHNGWVQGLHHFATTVRIPGVLQRIALCSLAPSVVFLLCSRASKPSDAPQSTGPVERSVVPGARGAWWGLILHDCIGLELLVVAMLLVGYWLLMALCPVPGFGAGVLTKDGNFSGYIDNLVLNGPVIGRHVWAQAGTWDPEGLISTLPAIATCLFGVLAGQVLRAKLLVEARAAWLFTMGFLLLLSGQVMSVWLPINKSIWTSSYAVFMAGLATLCFAVCYWLIDVQGLRRGVKPFAIYGMNAITVFVLAGVLGRLSLEVKVAAADGRAVALKTFLYESFFAPFASPDTAPFFGLLASPRNASLLWALLYVTGLYLVAYLMYRRKWFVRV